MVRTGELGHFHEALRKVETVFREKRHDGVETLLKMPVGIDDVGEETGFAAGAFIAAEGFARGFVSKALKLIEDLRGALAGGGFESGVKGVQTGFERFEQKRRWRRERR